MMKCYYWSKPFGEDGKPVRQHRKKMHRYWQQGGFFRQTEQQLCDQARAMRKNGWLSEVELEKIRREVAEDER